jgi:subtilisin family serine protease
LELNQNGVRKPVKVAIIDSGIDTSVHDLSNYVKKAVGFRVNEEGYIIEDADKEVKHEHGTAIALIIKHICSNVEFISVNILNENLNADGRVLIYAMEQTLQFKPDIIHMSLGTTKWRHILPIKSIVRQACKENIILVSAANNEGLRSYPAYLKGVVGVKAFGRGGYEDIYFEEGFYHAPFHTMGIPGIEELKRKNQGGSSMAAAYITGAIARIKFESNSATTEEVKTHLYNGIHSIVEKA